MEETGEVFVSTGRVRGHYMLRLCILNHSTSQAEVDCALDLAETLSVSRDEENVAPAIDYPDVSHGWLRRPTLDVSGLRAVPLFASLPDDLCDLVLQGAREVTKTPAEPIVEQWQATRDLYVVLSGTVDVFVDGEHVRELGAGEFFGELAALDWGAGFGRSRTASVIAATECRLLVLDWVLVNGLVHADDAFGETLERSASARLAGR